MDEGNAHATSTSTRHFIDHSNAVIHQVVNEALEVPDPETQLLDTSPTPFQKTANGCVFSGRLQEFNACRVTSVLFVGGKEPGDDALIFDGFIMLPLRKAKERPKRRCSLQIWSCNSYVVQGDGSVRHLNPSKSAWWRVFSKDVSKHTTDFPNRCF
jgi:hypothetical protein